MEEEFINAIHNKIKINITYYSSKAGMYVTRLCAPMDIGPQKRAADKSDRYHVWDYEGSDRPHPVPIEPKNIRSIDVTEENFDPADFVTWETDWVIARDWGRFS